MDAANRHLSDAVIALGDALSAYVADDETEVRECIRHLTAAQLLLTQLSTHSRQNAAEDRRTGFASRTAGLSG